MFRSPLSGDHHEHYLSIRARSSNPSNRFIGYNKLAPFRRSVTTRLCRLPFSFEFFYSHMTLEIVNSSLYVAFLLQSIPPRLVSFSKASEDNLSPASPSSSSSPTSAATSATTTTTSSAMADEFRFDDDKLEMDVSLETPSPPEAESGIDRPLSPARGRRSRRRPSHRRQRRRKSR